MAGRNKHIAERFLRLEALRVKLRLPPWVAWTQIGTIDYSSDPTLSEEELSEKARAIDETLDLLRANPPEVIIKQPMARTVDGVVSRDVFIAGPVSVTDWHPTGRKP